ncbi:hypothetical protein BKA70DRAFT_1250610 [Coprinopsis sp. MPI-PUGE-AT-0042]|nr:hypothetical protein BKA70DRAFT_1250610 [Coprinopsis sp. MPI-PUGE-AT-0042]
MPSHSSTSWLSFVAGTLVLVGCLSPLAEASLTPHLEQSFFFDWTPAGDPYPVPVTQQCETINIKWARGAAQGPNPVPPYYLQVYTSKHTTPVVIEVGDSLTYDWAVPFSPGTIYQICMFDKNGNTGGCQGTYTMIPSYARETPSCENVTYPPQLEVEGIVSNGPISMYGWIDQCTDIEVVPKGGTPPYTFTVAPSLHPPYNITGDGAMNWTVSLSWSSSFFISVADSAGAMWSNGLLHSGGGGSTACLAGSVVDPPEGVPIAAAIGAGVGGVAVGVLAGILTMFCCMRTRRKKPKADGSVDLSASGLAPTPFVDNSTGGSSAQYPTTIGSNMQYHVEPLRMPSEDGRRTFATPSHSSQRTSVVVTHAEPSFAPPAPSRTEHQHDLSPPHNPGAVYVLHHDSNTPPVTIYHEQGQQIVELPPMYTQNRQLSPPPPTSPGRSTSHASLRTDTTPSDGPAFLQQPRRPNTLGKGPTKGSNSSMRPRPPPGP